MTSRLTQGPAWAILLIDENRIFADVLAMRVREEPSVRAAAVAGSVPEAMSGLSALAPDLILVEYGDRGQLALRLMAELPGAGSRASVVVLSDVRDGRAVLAALAAGARGWVTKDSTFAVLWEALREVRTGHLVLSPSVVQPVVVRALESLKREPATARRDFVADLTPREYEVLQCLVAGMNKKEVAARLFLSVNTVRTHVRHLLQHADEHTTMALVAAARDLGVTANGDLRAASLPPRPPREQPRR